MRCPERLGHSDGYALLIAVFITAALLVTGIATIQLARSELHFTADQVAHHQAFYVAEAGIQDGLTRLHYDRSTSGSSTTYSYTGTGSSGGGSYSYSIAQDSLFPSDAQRKLITAVGTDNGQQSTVTAHALVQYRGPCYDHSNNQYIILSNGSTTGGSYGRARIYNNLPSVTNLFNGNILSNHDAEVLWNVSVATNAQGTVKAYNNFYSNALVTFLTTLQATLFYRGSYINEAGHSHLPLVAKGVHFANGVNGHGVQDLTIVSEPFPHPDYSALKSDSRTVVVNASNVPFGSWDSSTGTWTYNGALEFPASPSIIYYVEGNAKISSIYMSGGSTSFVVTRGSLWVGQIGVLYPGVSISGSVNVAVGPAGASASVVANVSVGSNQKLHLIAEKDLVLGRSDVSVSAGTAVETTTVTAVAYANAGLSLTTGLLNIASENDVLAWSETSTAWAMASGLDAAGTTRACVIGNGDATLAFRNSTLSTVLPYSPTI